MLPPLPLNPPGTRTRRPSQIAYRPSFEPFTTTQYMTPEPESWRLEELERYQVDNLILDDIKIAESMLRPTHTPSNQHFWFKEFFPRIAYEWCFWYDRTVTSDEVDHRIATLVSDMLYAFHHRIIDQATRQRYPVWELLESVRAVRDRLFTDTMGYWWDDEHP